MPSVLLLCAHRPDRSPSQRYRFEQYIPYLENKGFTFTWSYLLDKNDDKIFYSQGNSLRKAIILLKTILIRKKDSNRFNDFDIIFIQREALFLGSSRFEKKAFESAAKVIFDFDDSIWLADTSPGNKKWQWIKKPKKFFDNVKHAFTVIAGNEYLAEKARTINKNTVVIPTTINSDFHVPKPQLRNKGALVIGWSGSISTIKHFELLLPVLIRIRETFKEKVKIKIIGDKNYLNPKLETEAVEWSKVSEVDNLNSFDIGIMPLPNDEWAKGKCGLKGLSYMACQVATIMSNVGVNSEIIKNGVNGFLANNDEEWFNILCQLIRDSELRNKVGKEGRKTVIEKYSVEANKDKYLGVFKKAAQAPGAELK